MSLSRSDRKECVKLLKGSILFRECTEEELGELASLMVKKNYQIGEILAHEGKPQTHMFIVKSGSIIREKTEFGRVHHVDTQMGGSTVGSLHVINRDPAYATSKCVTPVITYELSGEDLDNYFISHPFFAKRIALSLTKEIRRYTKFYRTPLLKQHQKKTNLGAVSAAAAVESFYRSALNAVLNRQLTGVKPPSFFPNMHIQLPVRILYMNGFKGIRMLLDEKVNPSQYSTGVQLLAAFTPGLLMTPVSSVLEASVAGHSNPEGIRTRWMRGLLPRGAREIIFGVGLNQMSDYFEERMPFENSVLRNAGGSLVAGVVSGYFSHIPHNMSTLKLLCPEKSYLKHFLEYAKNAESRIPSFVPQRFVSPTSMAMACLFPKGVGTRTIQIVGSFVILNGLISAFSNPILQDRVKEVLPKKKD